MVYATRLVNYLYPLTQTIYHTSRNVKIVRMTRADAVGIYLVLGHVTLQHWNSPCRQPTTLQLDNIPMRISIIDILNLC